ncbi:MAG: LLM class flavin-dependent oxidoreductase [Actinomycetes bacterium]
MADEPLATGVWFQGGLKVDVATALAVQAEQAGVDSVWVAEGPIARDAFVTLCSMAVATSRVELSTGVVNPFTRHPAQLAASFASLDELSGGRAACGIGIGARDFLTPIGADVSKPYTAAREMVETIRRLLAREDVVLDGQVFTLNHVRLGFRPPREDMPIYLAATGPKMCALAGEATDGIYLLYGTEQYLGPAIARAREARTTDAPFKVASPILLGIDNGDESVKASLRAGVGLNLSEPNAESVLEANGLDPALAQPIRDGLANGGIKGLIAAVDQSIVDKLTIFGTHAQCVDRLVEAVSWGINEPQVLLSGGDPTPQLNVIRDLKAQLA